MNVLRDGDGNDTITFAFGARNTVEGGSGNDTIKADSTNSSGLANTIIGGTGNDTITAGQAADTFMFNRGDGIDTLLDHGGSSDKLVFGAGISQSDLVYSRVGDSLVIDVTDPSNALASDQITIQKWFTQGFSAGSYPYQIEQIVFENGSTVLASEASTLSNRAALSSVSFIEIIGISEYESVL